MNILRTVEELDLQLKEVDRAAQISDDELRRALSTFAFQQPAAIEHLDPYSAQYREQQFRLYEYISGRGGYDPQNERFEFNVEELVRTPFPYCTKSAQTVGDHLMAIGFTIKTMSLPPGAKILEFGPGWGNTTIALAQMGYAVTGVDIEPRYAELIRRRAEILQLDIRTVTASFGPPPALAGETFDAVLFFECFHHCSDHLALIGQLKSLVSDHGILVFAAEPIFEEFPVAWGIRLEGMSVWSIRRFGWLELAFKESYFVRTMLRYGWVVEKHTSSVGTIGTIFTARRNRGSYELGRFLLPKDEDRTWAPAESDPAVGVRFTSGESVISLDEDDRWRSVAADVSNFALCPVELRLSCGRSRIAANIPPGETRRLRLGLQPGHRALNFSSPSWVPSEVGLNADGRKLGVAVHRIDLSEESV